MGTERKKILAFLICMCIMIGLESVAWAEENPISIKATTAKDQTFTVRVSAAADTDMQAFKYQVGYDRDRVKVIGEEGIAYDFSDSFLRTYNADGSALMVYNNLEKGKESYLVFTGAQVDSQKAVLPEDTELCFIQFQFTDNSIATAEQAGIYLKVELLKGQDGLVREFPQQSVKTELISEEIHKNNKDSITTDTRTGKKLTEDYDIPKDSPAEKNTKVPDTEPDKQDAKAKEVRQIRQPVTDTPLPSAAAQPASEVSGGDMVSGSIIEPTGIPIAKADKSYKSKVALKGRQDNHKKLSFIYLGIGLAAAGVIIGCVAIRRIQYKKSEKV